MLISLIFLCMNTQLDITGYAETRPYILFGDTVRITGFTRGWIVGKTTENMYGGQVALEVIVPYDTFTTLINVQDVVTVSRCAVWLGPETMRMVLGRQRINWGVGRVFRPLDVFNPTNFLEPGYERRGYDAAYGYIALNALTNVRGVYTPTYDPELALYGANIRTTILHTDLGATALHRSEDRYTLIGGEIAGELEVGFWGEGVYIQNDTIDHSTFVVGIDYSFPLRLYAMVEYYFDGSGVDDPAEYDFSLIMTGQRMTLAQHYLYSTISTIPLPFDVVRPSLNMLVNVNDQGVVIIPQVNITPFENADIAVGGNFFVGSDDCEFRNLSPFQSAVYIWTKIYF